MIPMKKASRYGWFCLMIVVLTACPMDPGPAPENDEIDDAASILRALGVSAVDNPPDLVTTSTTGESVTIENPGIWTPLKKTYSVFNPAAEVCQIGIPVGDYSSAMFGDGKNDSYASSVPITGNQTWQSTCAKRSCAADLNRDGLDEIVVFYTPTNGGSTLNVTVYSVGSGAFSTPVETSLTVSEYLDDCTEIQTDYCHQNGFSSVWANYTLDYFDITPADLDGDGADEILFRDYDTLHVLRVNADGSTVTELESHTYDAPIQDAAAGDCDGDGKDEFLVSVQGLGCQLYDSSLDSDVLPDFIRPQSGADMYELCFGDFDGDNIDEIVIVGNCPLYSYARSYEYSPTGLMLKREMLSSITGQLYDIKSLPRAVDIDGNGTDELCFSGVLCRDVLSSSPIWYSSYTYQLYGIDDVQIGDVDGDGKEDIVVLGRKVSDSEYQSYIGAYGVGSNNDMERLLSKNHYVQSSPETALEDPSPAVTMAVGNFDRDSARVKYSGHQLQFTNPIVIAVLASPPYYSEIQAAEASYDPSGWTTSFGTSSSSTVGHAGSVGMSVGVSVEFEQGVNIFGAEIASFKASASFSAATTTEFSNTMSIGKSITYSCAGGEDRVIFTSIPIDVYSYTVLESPVPGDVGKTMTIEIPRNYSIYTVDKDFFNQNSGALPDIGSAVLPHTLGSPGSYPNGNDKSELLTKYIGYSSQSALPVGQYNPASGTSGGVTTLEIEVEEAEEASVSVDLGYEVSIGAGAGGVTVSANLGFNVGYRYTMSTTEGTAFGGTIGNLPTSYYNSTSYLYSQGLFVYAYEDPDSMQTYWVVNYWVDD